MMFSGLALATSTAHHGSNHGSHHGSNGWQNQPAEFWSDCAVGSNCQVYSILGVNDNATKSNGEPVIDGMHGLDDWTYLAKAESDDHHWSYEDNQINFSVTGNEKNGTWSMDDIWNSYDQIALVFKDGNNTSLVSYILNNGTTSGAYSSPFTTAMFDGINHTKDISHISVYGQVASVPLPAASWLFIGGLMTLFGFRKKVS